MSDATVDPIFAALDEAKRLHEHVDFEATGTEPAAEAWDRAVERIECTKATTLAGVLARLDYLAQIGERDYETAVEVLRGIAAR